MTHTMTQNISSPRSSLNLIQLASCLLILGIFFLGSPVLKASHLDHTLNLSVKVDVGDANCDASDGIVAAQPDGGLPPYTYLWSNGATTQIVTGLPAGSYTVTVTDDTGNTASATGIVNTFNGGIVVETAASYETCVGSQDAHADAIITGGTPPYSYLWSNGQTTVTATNLSAGFYTVTITDANGCQGIGSIEVELSPEGIWVMTTSTDVTCFGGSDGTAYVGAMTGVPPYTYIWSNGATVKDPGGLPADQYFVTVTDVNGCSAVDSVVVNQPPDILLTANVTNTPCNLTIGAIDLTASGGTPPYTFDWADLAGTNDPEDRSGLGEGFYSVTLTDANGCTKALNNLEVIDDCPLGCENPIIASVVVIEASCGENNGSATVNITGNPAAYSYVWTPNVSTGPSATGLAAGTYTVVITDLADPSCFVTETFTVGSIDGPKPATIDITNATCDAADGSVTVTPATFTYEWCNGSTGTTVTGLPAGECQVTITDPSTGCVNVCEFIIGSDNPLALSATTNDADCDVANGSATINITGGSGNYTFDWSIGGPSTNTRTDLASGIYSVTVTDTDTNCEASITFTILDEVAGGATIVINNAPVETSCPGENDGEVDFTVTLDPNFLGPETVTIKDVAGNTATNGSLSPGDYCIEVRDANNCFVASECFEVIDAPQLDVDVTIINKDCIVGGSIGLAITRGTPPYTVDWADLPGTDNMEDRMNLAPGTYSFTVTDAHGCSVSESGLIVGDDCPPSCIPPVITSVVVIEANCGANDGAATVNISGNSTYTYAWTPNVSTGPSATGLAPGTYTVLITDQADASCFISETFTVGSINGPKPTVDITNATCDAADGSVTASPATFTYEWCNGTTGPTATGLPAGECQVTVTDPVTGCVNVCEFIIGSDNPLSLTADTQDTDCGQANGSATINVAGGSGNYTFDWNIGGANTATRTDLASGIYVVTVTDTDTNCEATIFFTILDIGAGGATIDVDQDTVQTSCPDVKGGEVVFTVTLDPGFLAPDSVIIKEVTSGTVATNGSLAPGQYVIQVFDGAGCFVASANVTVVDAPQLDVDIAVTDKTCTMGGTINLFITRGTPPYTVDWADLPGADNMEDRMNLDPGTYSFTVTDANGCSVTESGLIVGDDCPPACVPPVIESVVVIEAQCGEDNGSATVNISGSSTYSFTWTPNVSSGASATNLAVGTYEVKITDLADTTCMVTEVFTVGSVNGPKPTVDITNATCDATDGSATASPDTFIYEWCNGTTGATATGLPAGECQVTVTDPSTGCVNVCEFIVGSDNPLSLTADTQDTDCGQANGSATINVTGGSGNYTFDWNIGGAMTATRTDLPSGIYAVTVTDLDTNCEATIFFTILDIGAGGATIDVEQDTVQTSCPDVVDGEVVFTITLDPGFLAPDSVIIKEVSSGAVATNGSLAPGQYVIQVFDGAGCFVASENVTVVDAPQLDVDVAVTDKGCLDGGTINLFITRGTPPYTIDWADLPGTDNIEDRVDLDAGNYGFTVTDANGCSVAVNDLIVEDTCDCITPIIQSILVIEADCNQSNGNATITMANGQPSDFNFTWEPPVSTTNELNGVAAGTYSVTITDNSGDDCPPVEETFTIGQVGGPQATVTTTPATCVAADGTATLLPDSFTYTWNDGSTGSTRNDLAAGTYFVTISDPNDPNNPPCDNFITVVIDQVGDLEVSAEVESNPDCGVANGTVSINVTNSAGTATFTWSDGGTGQTRSDLAAGVYTVNVSDADGCKGSVSFVLTDNIPGTADVDITPINVSCAGAADGAIDFTFDLSPDFINPPNITIQDADGNTYISGNLAPGEYCLIILDAEGCVAGGDCFTIEDAPQIDADVAVVDGSCEGNGSITFTDVSGGTPPYAIIWDDGTTDFDRPNLAGGTYSFTITDSNNCPLSATLDVAPSDALMADIDLEYLDCGPDQVIVQFDAVVTGGGQQVMYDWDFDNGQTSNQADPIITFDENDTLNVVLIVMSGECKDTAELEVIIDLFNVDIPDRHVICDSMPVMLNPNGNTSYIYEWTPADGLSATNIANPSANPDQTTTYTVTVLNVNGADTCQLVQDVEVIVPPAIDLVVPGDTVICVDSILLTATAVDGAIFEWTDEQGTVISNTGSVFVTPTDSNYYFVTARDTFGCDQMDSVLVVEGGVDVTLSGNTLFCENEDGTLTLINQDPDDILVIDWSPDSLIVSGDSTTEVIIVTDTTYTGTIYVDVENQYGCTFSDSITVTVFDTSENAIVLDTKQCTPFEVEFTISGPNAGFYSLFYGDPAHPDSSTTDLVSIYTYSDAGTYEVLLIANDSVPPCIEDTIRQEIMVAGDPISNVDFDFEIISCADTAVVQFFDQSTHETSDIIAWNWEFSNGATDTVQNPIITVTETGELEVFLQIETDAGCIDSLRDTIVLDLITVDLNDVIFGCLGEDVPFTVDSLGIDTAFNYSWSPADLFDDPNADEPTLQNLMNDTLVTVVITNADGSCTLIDTVFVDAVDLAEIDLMDQDTIYSCGPADTTVVVSAPGAQLYEWATNPEFDPVIATGTTFDVTPGDPSDPNVYYVRAVNGECSVMDSIVVANFEVVFEFRTGDLDLCFGDVDTLELELNGGLGERPGEFLTFDWFISDDSPIDNSTIPSEPSISPTDETGFITVEVSNQFNCTLSDTINFNVFSFGGVFAEADPDTIVRGGLTSQLSLQGILPGYEYLWDNAGSLDDPTIDNPVASPSETTLYTAQIFNTLESGLVCETEARVPVVVISPLCEEPFIFFPNAFSPNGDGENDFLRLRAFDQVDEVFWVVYTRWGEKVFEANDLNAQWDGSFKGKEPSPGVYAYYLRVLCAGGEEFIQKGNVTLFR